MLFGTKSSKFRFLYFLDMSKAFIRLQYCKLFGLMVNRQTLAFIVRVSINLHTGNYVRVHWCLILSDKFLAVNGVKLGGILSHILLCLYVDGLLMALSQAGVVCFIGDNFVGALAHADDIVLLAPSASALCTVLAICDIYADDYQFRFIPVNLNASWFYLQLSIFM